MYYRQHTLTVRDGFEYEQSSLLEEESMFPKFKMTTYATLLLITVFVLPYAGSERSTR